MTKYLILLIVLSFSSCISPVDKGEVNIFLKKKESVGDLPIINTVKLENDKIIIQGSNFKNVNSVKLNTQTLSILSNTDTLLDLSAPSAITLSLNTLLNLVIDTAHGAASVPVIFNLVDGSVTASKIGDGEIGLNHLSTTMPGLSAGKILSFNGTSWEVKSLDGLVYKGTFDASSTVNQTIDTPTTGHYYIVSNAGSNDPSGAANVPMLVGDWAVYNESTMNWDKVVGSNAVTSVNGLSGVVSLSLGNLNNVDTTGASNGKVLKFDGTNWIVGDDLSGGGVGSVTSTEIQDGSVTDDDLAGGISQAKITGLSTVVTQVSDNASDIATNSSDIATNSTSIATNASNISTNTTSISSLNSNKVDKSVTINGKALSSNITLTTTDVGEGTNLYFTDARAKAASVVNSTAGTQTDQAASVSAMKTYVTSQISSFGTGDFKKDGTVAMTGDLDFGNNKARFKSTNTNYVELKAPDTLAATYSLILPPNDGDVGQILSTNGTGTLTWIDAASGADNLGDHTATAHLKMKNFRIIMDNDEDTYFYSSSDDQIDFSVGGLGSLRLWSGALDTNMTGTFSLKTNGAGTASAPAYAFAGDSGTGLFRPSANNLGISTNGAERIRIDATGNVGIGETSPIKALDINSNSGNNLRLKYSDDDTRAFDFLINTNGDLTVESTNNRPILLNPTATGGVGIGTSPSAGAKLEVAGQVKITGGTPGLGKILTSDASGLASWQTPASGSDNLGNHTATQNIDIGGNKIISSGGTYGLSVGNTGHVGIGVGAGYHDLMVYRNDPGAPTIQLTNSSYGTSPSDGATISLNGWVNSFDHYETNGIFRFNHVGYTANLEMKAGRVGINTYADDANLEISKNGVVSSVPFMISTNDNDNGDILIVNASGDVGIGTKTPGAKLHVVGDIHYTGMLTDISDKRLKENIKPLDGAMDVINKINTYSYTMKNDPEQRTEFGVIAQEMRQILPPLVSEIDPVEGFIGVNYVGLIPWTIEALKEQDKQINENKREIASLREDITKLNKTIEELVKLNKVLIESIGEKKGK